MIHLGFWGFLGGWFDFHCILFPFISPTPWHLHLPAGDCFCKVSSM